MFDILKMMHFNPQTAGAFYPQIDNVHCGSVRQMEIADMKQGR